MRFHDAWFLLLLLVPVFAYRSWRSRAKPAAFRYSIPVPEKASFRDPTPYLTAFRVLSLALLIFALARPQGRFSELERKVSGVEILMVMDVSASMNIEDLDERPRLEIAKDTMRKFIEKRTTDRIGFVIFSGEPLTMAPPTLDYSMVLAALKNVETGVLKDGTGIGDGLALAVNRLRGSTAKSRVIVLLTDGDNNVGQVDPLTAGELAAGYGIRVYTIAIGKEGRVKLPIRQKGLFGRTVTTYQWFENALNPELLQKIAEGTKGKFYRVTEAGALNEVFSDIDRLEKSDVQITEKTRYEERFGFPLKAALLLLCLERILALFWWRMLA